MLVKYRLKDTQSDALIEVVNVSRLLDDFCTETRDVLFETYGSDDIVILDVSSCEYTNIVDMLFANGKCDITEYATRTVFLETYLENE